MARRIEKTASIALPAPRDGDRTPRIVVVADTHSAPHEAIGQRLTELRPVAILHAGDIGDLAVLESLKAFAPVFAVRGNIDVHAPEVPDQLVVDVHGSPRGTLQDSALHIAVFARGCVPMSGGRPARSGHRSSCLDTPIVPFMGADHGLTLFNPVQIGPRRFGRPLCSGPSTSCQRRCSSAHFLRDWRRVDAARVRLHRVIDLLLRKWGASHVQVFGGAGGGIVPREIAQIEAYGVTKIFRPVCHPAQAGGAARPSRAPMPVHTRGRPLPTMSAGPPVATSRADSASSTKGGIPERMDPIDGLIHNLREDVAAGRTPGLGQYGSVRLSTPQLDGAAGSLRSQRCWAQNCDSLALGKFSASGATGIVLAVFTGNYKDEGCGVASAAGALSILSEFREPFRCEADLLPALRRGTERAHQEVCRLRSVKLGNYQYATVMGQRRDLQGIGASVTAVALRPDRLDGVHIGEGRAYLVRGGIANKLALEHTLANHPAVFPAVRSRDVPW
jgi:hypothetical protein